MRPPILFALCLFAALAQQLREKRVVPVADAQRQSFERQPKIAILAGISAYPDGSGLTPLKYAAADVDDLAAELRKQGYAVRQLKDSQATRGVITRTLSQIGENLDPDQGTLLFYFSGHGFAAANGVNYLATFGASIDDLQRDGLALTEVEQLMKASRARRQILWVDACRNDARNGARSAGARSFNRLDAAEGLRVLYSTRQGSYSYEDDGLRHGVFTWFLLKGLRGDAAGADGLLTFQDLAGYVGESVMNYGIETGHSQRPFEAGEASGDFLVGRVNERPPTIAPPPPAETPALRTGQTKVNPKDGLTYVWIEPGTFMMGCSPGDNECAKNEKPARRVTISRGFWMGQTDVTQEAWQRVTGSNPSRFKGARLPVESVTWTDGQNYCRATGMRLPTDAEWEYAARAGSTQSRYGDLDRIAWYKANSGGKTHEVKQKEPNAWGLYDMLGNVWQWTDGWYDAPKLRALRGNSWIDDPKAARASALSGYGDGGSSVFGVRCAGN